MKLHSKTAMTVVMAATCLAAFANGATAQDKPNILVIWGTTSANRTSAPLRGG
jgi:hypothetical protein